MVGPNIPAAIEHARNGALAGKENVVVAEAYAAAVRLAYPWPNCDDCSPFEAKQLEGTAIKQRAPPVRFAGEGLSDYRADFASPACPHAPQSGRT